MLRKVLCAALGLIVFVGLVLADEVKGKVEKVNVEKNVISVKVEGKEKAMNFKAGPDTKILGTDGKELKDGVKGIKEGSEVTVTYEKQDKKTIVKSIKVIK
ncbi:MAG TPA: hypothetical protein VNK04_14720 [Gemmataceae bacterium]|nr:hypothetical protein [Gemmataceae bacterium]